jgi:hypothetical protein
MMKTYQNLEPFVANTGLNSPQKEKEVKQVRPRVPDFMNIISESAPL